MRSFILVLFTMAILVTGGYAQAETQGGVETLFSFSSASIKKIDAVLDSTSKYKDSNFKIERKKSAKDSIIYLLSCRDSNNWIDLTVNYKGEVLGSSIQNVLRTGYYFKYSARKTFVKNGYYSNFMIVEAGDKDNYWFPNKKKELPPNIEEMSKLINYIESKCSSLQ